MDLKRIEVSVEYFKGLDIVRNFPILPMTILTGATGVGKTRFSTLLKMKDKSPSPTWKITTVEDGCNTTKVLENRNGVSIVKFDYDNDCTDLNVYHFKETEPNSNTYYTILGSKDKNYITYINRWICSEFGLFRSIEMDERLGMRFVIGGLISVGLDDLSPSIMRLFRLVSFMYIIGKNSVVILEHPELGLDDRLQCIMFDYLYEHCGVNKRIILETNSNALVTRMRRRVIENRDGGMLDYISYTHVCGSKFHTLVVTKEGIIEDDCFDDSVGAHMTEENSKLIKARCSNG